jgi:hypothetical protein
VSEHTPTPWAADPDDREDMEWNIHIVEASQPHMRVCFMTSNGPAEANAAFIVEAVNNHETLKAENKRLRSELEQARACIKWTNEVYPDRIYGKGARVELTWDEFNAMREAAGFRPAKIYKDEEGKSGTNHRLRVKIKELEASRSIAFAPHNCQPGDRE